VPFLLVDALAAVAALPAASPVVDRGGRDGGAVNEENASDLPLKPTAPKVRGVRPATQVGVPCRPASRPHRDGPAFLDVGTELASAAGFTNETTKLFVLFGRKLDRRPISLTAHSTSISSSLLICGLSCRSTLSNAL
jgi:hypothetical protein